MKTKDQYKNIYEKRYDFLYKEAEQNPEVNDAQLEATEAFEETCTTEEVVGYYVKFYEENAYNAWIKNIEGIKTTKQDDEITKILKGLFDENI